MIMRKIISLFITVPLSLFVLLFAVSNTHSVEVSFDIVELSVQTSLYIIGLGLMAIGFLVGCILVWLNLYGYRIKYWRVKRQNTRLEDEMTRLKNEHDAQMHDTQNQPVKIGSSQNNDPVIESQADPQKIPYYDR